MIQITLKPSLVNGHKITLNNWENIIAVSDRPCTHVHGVEAIDNYKKEHGIYFEKWQLIMREGFYIFREVNYGGGISGRYTSVEGAIIAALQNSHIQVFLKDE